MIRDIIFEWLVEHHLNNYYTICRPHMIDGVLLDPHTQSPFNEGSDLRQWYPGLLVLANGENLPQRLHDDGFICDTVMENSVPIPNKQSFFNYLQQTEGRDGVYVIDTIHNTVTHVSGLNDDHPLVQKYKRKLLERLPDDFVYSNGTPPTESDIGRRTYIADLIPLVLKDIEAFQIKQSSWGNIGIGKVTNFNSDGLAKEFYFWRQEPGVGTYMKDEDVIFGATRQYEHPNGKPSVKSQKNQVVEIIKPISLVA